MNEINRVLGKAAWRLGVVNFLRGWVVMLAVVLGGAILLRLVEQLLAFTSTASSRVGPALPGGAAHAIDSAAMWWQYLYWGAGATVVGGLVWAIAARPKKLAVARRVDEGANLRESLSTALCVASQTDPWARATVENASRTARGVNVRDAVPIQAPRFWPVVVALGLSLAVVYLALPRLDVLGWYKSAVAEKNKQVEIVNARQEVQAIQKKIEEQIAKIPSLDKDAAAEAPAAEKPEPQSPEEIRKAMIAQLTKRTEQLEELKTGAQAQKLEAIQSALKNLKQPGPETSELSKAMAKGDFSAAKQELEKIQSAMASSDMSQEAKDQMAAQLEDMAKQLERMAENREGMEKLLEQAGIPKEALASKEAMKDAIQKSENLSQEQKDALESMCEGGMECQNALAQMAEAMSQMSQQAKSGEGQQPGESGGEQMSEQLSEMEALAQEMQMAEAAMSECQSAMNQLGQESSNEGMGECSGGMGEGDMAGNNTRPWSSGWNQSMGGGRGGPGLGQGGRPGEARADFELEKKKSIGAKGDGPIVSSKLVEGESIRGESKAEFSRAVTTAEQNATEAIENNVIPREYHDAIKSYFGRLKGKAGPGGGAKSTEPAKAEPEADAEKK